MVAMNAWPTDGADGSVSNEARWRKMARHWVGSGVVPGQGGLLAPSLAGSNLTIKAGAAWVDGHYAELVSDQVLAATADGIAVIRFDPAANTAELLWRSGVGLTPTQNPTGIYELLVASTTGSVLTDQRTWAGDQIFYTQIVANVTVTATTVAGAQTVLTAPPITFDGSPIWLEFYSTAITAPAVAGASTFIALWDGATDLGTFGQLQNNPAAGSPAVPFLLRRRISPAPGSHTFVIKSYVLPSGSALITANAGNAPQAPQPAYFRAMRG